MNILVSTDDNYANPLLVMLYSLFINNMNEEIRIYLLYSKLKRKNAVKIKKICDKYGKNITFIKIQEELFTNFPEIAHLTVATYFRLFATLVLPKEITRILYLDVDVIVNKPLKELYETDLDNYMFGAVIAPQDYPKEIKRRLGISLQSKAINAGVMLMNLEEMRKKIDYKKVYDYINKYGKKLICADQDVINALFYKQIKYVDSTYNYLAVFTSAKEIFLYPITWYRNLKSPEIAIIHYAKRSKPWNIHFGQQALSIYQKYETASGIVPYSAKKNIINCIFWIYYAFREM